MTEHLTKRTIDHVDQDVSACQNDETRRSKKVKWDSDERNKDICENTTKHQQQNEDRNNSNGPVKVKVTVSEFNERLKVSVPDPIPYRIVVNNEKCKKRNFDDEAQKASHILKNIVMEKMNDKLTDESLTSAFQRVQQHDYQPMPCKAPYSRPALPVHRFPSQRSFCPPFVRQNFAAFGNLTSHPRVGIPRLVEQSGKIMVQPIPPVSSVTIRNLPPIHGTVPATAFIQTSTGTAVQATGTTPSIDDQAYGLPSSEYFNKITSPAIKATPVQVMPGTSLMYKTPGASHKNRHGKVKRPMNAFMVWARNYRSRLSEEMPQASNAQISVRLGQIWGSMSLADKETFFREAERIKLQHNRDFPGWVYQPKQKKIPTETQHDRLWARFGSNTCKDQPKEVTANTCQEETAAIVHQIVTPTPVTVYPKTPIVNTPNTSMTSPLPSFSQLTQTVSDPTPIVSIERQRTPGSSATTDGTKSGPLSGSIGSSQEFARRPTAFKLVSSSQPPTFTAQPPTKTESKTGPSPLKITTSSSMGTNGIPTNGSVKSLSSGVTGCPSPKGRPPSISHRVSLSGTQAMLISAQRAYQEAIMTRSHSDGPSKTKPTISSGPITTTRISDQRQKPDAMPLTTVIDVRPPGSKRPQKCADPMDELWPFPLPTVEHTPHVDVLYDDHLRYERESGPGYIDPYNPFYYDGSYDDTRSGLQIDVNSWQKYLNYTKMQNETEDKTNLNTCFPPPSSTSVWCDQTPNNADHYAMQANNQKPSGSLPSQAPRRTSSESCFASSLTSAINVLDDVNTGDALTPNGYANINIHGYHQSKITQSSRNAVDLQRQSNALQALDLSSGTHTQTSVSNIVYLGQETTHIGSGDSARSVNIEGSPPDKSEDSRPLKKRTERYRRDFPNGRSCVTSGDVPTGTYLEDVVFLTSPEKIAGEEVLSRNLQKQANESTTTGSNEGLANSPKLVIDVGHDFVKSLQSGTVITDLIPANLTNSKSVQLDSVVEPAANHTQSKNTAGNAKKRLDVGHDIEPCLVNIKKEMVDNF